MDFSFNITVKLPTGPKPAPLHQSRLIKDLENALADPRFTDAILKCEGIEIPCHRFILAAR